MPRPTRAQKDKKKAKEEALKASEAITNGNTISTSNSASCGTSSHLVLTGGETRVLTAGESKQENVTKSNASEVIQDKRPEKGTAEIGKERSDGGERGPGENKHRKVIEVNDFTLVQNKRSQKSRAEIANERSGGGERGPGENKHQKVIEFNASATVQDKRADKSRAEIANARSGSGERGPSRKSSEEEKVSLQPSQLESRQKQRDDRPSFAGNKGFRQDFNGRNSSASQNYGGYNSRQGGQHGYYENRGSGRGGYNEGDNIDALGRAFGEGTEERGDDDALLERYMSRVRISPLLPSSAGAQGHHEHGERSGAAANMLPTTLSETPTTLVDPDWQEGDPIGTRGWRDFVTSIGTRRPVCASHGLQRSAGRHEDIFEPVALLRAELEALEELWRSGCIVRISS